MNLSAFVLSVWDHVMGPCPSSSLKLLIRNTSYTSWFPPLPDTIFCSRGRTGEFHPPKASLGCCPASIYLSCLIRPSFSPLPRGPDAGHSSPCPLRPLTQETSCIKTHEKKFQHSNTNNNACLGWRSTLLPWSDCSIRNYFCWNWLRK